MLASFALLLFFVHAPSVDATISVVATRQHFPSKPDGYIGKFMRRGVEYQARLQRIPGNDFLCVNTDQQQLPYPHLQKQNWNITRPDDGSPGVCVCHSRHEIL
jgi:hypothetical protein